MVLAIKLGIKLTQKSTQSKLNRRWAASTPDQRREMIVDVAMDLLHRRGPHEVTVRRVAERLGVGAMTLYTYVQGQDELRRAMMRRGFEMLHQGCRDASTLGSDHGWRGGSRHYLQFAVENPNLYHLMFSMPTAGEKDDEVLQGGLRPLLERVRERLEKRGLKGAPLERESLAAAGRFWIALHGLASLAIAGRLSVLHRDPDALLDDLLPRVQPDDGE